MQIILLERIEKLGQMGDVVNVKPGYARNFLLPRKLALLVTEGNKKHIERERGKFDVKEAEEKRIAEALAAKGFSLDRRKIHLPDPLKKIGDVDVPIRLYPDVTATIKVRVVAEGKS